MNTVLQGKKIESIALQFLKRNQLKLRAKNYRTRCGELDLIMQDGHCIVFVEVRYRSHTRYGDGAASIDRRKQRKLALTAQSYLQSKRLSDAPCRFDVISVSQSKQESVKIDWIKNAFDHQG